LKFSDPFGATNGYEQCSALLEPPFGLALNRRFLFQSEFHSPAVGQLTDVESYSLSAASFQSQARATELASSLRLLGLPVFVRALEGWHAAVVGRFASRDEAAEALARVQLTTSPIVSTAPAESGIVQPLRTVATTGQKGQP